MLEQVKRDVATAQGDSGTAGKRICMLAYTIYECDNRVRRYAEALVKRGDIVDVIAISGENLEKASKTVIDGVTVYRVQHRDKNERSKWTYAWRLLRFFSSASAMLTRLHRKQRYDVIHIHNMPDFLVFAAWYPKITGAGLILDVHDLVPELFGNKFPSRMKYVYIWFLKLIERVSAAFVNHVIISNDLWYDTITRRSIDGSRCSVLLNHVDPEVFYRRPRSRTDGKFLLLFPGSLQWHQGLDIAIRAFAQVKSRVQDAEFHIYGEAGGDNGLALKALVETLGLSDSVKFCGSLPLDQIVDVIANADLGVVPKRADSFGNEAYSTKIMEFMSQGIPVVVSRTKVDSFYFEEGVVHFFTPGDSNALASAILDVIYNPDLRDSLIARGLEYCTRNDWATKKSIYLELVDSLAKGS